LKLGPIEWEDADLECEVNKTNGITSAAFQEEIHGEFRRWIRVGYNGILKGERVFYDGDEYTVVMVSRLGHFGLSKTGKLPYTERVSPNEVLTGKVPDLHPKDGESSG